jgi:hypothetical protein
MKSLRWDIALVGLVAGVYYFAADFFIPFSEGRDAGTYFFIGRDSFNPIRPTLC